MAERKKPGDLSQLGLTDPLLRDASWLYPRLGTLAPGEQERNLKKRKNLCGC
jgi:hypothetical protein